MPYQTMDITIEGGFLKDADAQYETRPEIQKGLDKGNAKGWKLHTIIQTFSEKDINVYLLIWETE